MAINIQHDKISAPGIIVENASLQYNGEWLFDNLNLSIPGGQCTCLLGPSGIGKSSLLRMLANLTPSSTNMHTHDKQPLQPFVSYMPQQDLLMPWLSIINNVLISARLCGIKINSDLRDHAQHLLTEVGLSDVVQHSPATLSGGMRQRVALARTLFENKPIVLMDEPFASLDVITKLQLQDLTSKLLATKTIILVTHDPLEALRLGEHIYVMSGKPATLEKVLTPVGRTPRKLGDPNLVKLEAQLLQKLQQAYEMTRP